MYSRFPAQPQPLLSGISTPVIFLESTRSHENAYFQKDRNAIEKRAGHWLKDLARETRLSASI
jgi:hypothetical protein